MVTVSMKMIRFLQTALGILIIASAGLGSICPAQHPTDKPRFTVKLEAENFADLHENIAIRCCSEGYDNISWYKQEEGVWTSYPRPSQGDENAPALEENRQILRIPYVQKNNDARYKCHVEKGTHVVLSHSMRLLVKNCDKLGRGPIPTRPFPENTTIYEYGRDLSFHCSGYFGCSQDNLSPQLNTVEWAVYGRADDIWSIDKRYNVSNWQNETNKASTLNITNVQEIDTQRTFLCILSSAQTGQGQTITFVRIFKLEKPKSPWLTIALCVGGGILFILLVVSLTTWLKYMYGPRIRLFVNSRMPSLGAKLVDDGQFEYNVYIHHAADDARFATKLKEDLNDCGYKVSITNDVQPGEKFLTKVFETSKKSASIFVIYSDNLLEDEMADFIIQSLVQEKSGRDIIFLEVTDYQAEALMNRILKANVPDTGEMGCGYWTNPDSPTGKSIESKFGGSVQDIDGELSHENKAEAIVVRFSTQDHRDETARKEIISNLKYWKVLPRIKVPGEKTNTRKQMNYLCSIQNRIPKFRSSVENRKKDKRRPEQSLSSGTPLLESQPASKI